MKEAGSKNHLLSSLRSWLRPAHGRLQRAGAAAGQGPPPAPGCKEAGCYFDLVQPLSSLLYNLFVSKRQQKIVGDRKLWMRDRKVRAQVSSKHKPGNPDSTSLEKSGNISVFTHSSEQNEALLHALERQGCMAEKSCPKLFQPWFRSAAALPSAAVLLVCLQAAAALCTWRGHTLAFKAQKCRAFGLLSNAKVL